MKEMIKFGVIPFGLALGFGVAYRLSAEAMAVVVGVMSAVVACTVMGGLLLIIIRATNQRTPIEPNKSNIYPPIMIVQPGVPTQYANNQPMAWPVHPYPQVTQRSFSIVGEDGDD